MSEYLLCSAGGCVDASAILESVQRHEGPESAAIAKAWLAIQPDAWSVVRASEGTVAGLLCTLAIEDRGALHDVSDPAVAAAYAELARHSPLRQGERFTLVRYWMSAVGYQGVSYALIGEIAGTERPDEVVVMGMLAS